MSVRLSSVKFPNQNHQYLIHIYNLSITNFGGQFILDAPR